MHQTEPGSCLSAGCCSCNSHHSHPACREQAPKISFLPHFVLPLCCWVWLSTEWAISVAFLHKSCCGGEFSSKGKPSEVPHRAGRAVAVKGEGTLTSSFYPGPSSLHCHSTDTLLVCLLFCIKLFLLGLVDIFILADNIQS